MDDNDLITCDKCCRCFCCCFCDKCEDIDPKEYHIEIIEEEIEFEDNAEFIEDEDFVTEVKKVLCDY